MFRLALLTAFLLAFVAGCNSDDKTFKTESASPTVALPPGFKVPDQKGTPKGDAKPGKKEPN